MSQVATTSAQPIPAEAMERSPLPTNITANLPSMVRNELLSLPIQRQEEFLEEYRRRARKPALGYFLWLIGWHFAYLKRWGMQVVYILSFGGLIVWQLVELFLVGRRMREYNRDVAIDVLRHLKEITRA